MQHIYKFYVFIKYTPDSSYTVTSETPVNVEKLGVYISGGGDVYYSGNPEKVSVDARGGSEVHKE
ncbi:MAG: hypothetical protein A2V64_02065 [Bacteroidetes bacterium RBG_13_43_22]|nr:MAG: hypothetical protein A2V64_02065 [Bacteroidetes bacterium RBG_13_43_22]